MGQNRAMTFAVGLLVGCGAAVAVGLLVARFWRGSDRAKGPDLTTWLAAVALVLSIVALVRSGRDSPTPTAEPTPPSTATAPAPTAPLPTTTVTTARATVEVPNLVGLPRAIAVQRVQGLGLQSDVETLALASTPSGYVVSQTPLPASRLPVGSTVVLVVSSAA